MTKKKIAVHPILAFLDATRDTKAVGKKIAEAVVARLACIDGPLLPPRDKP